MTRLTGLKTGRRAHIARRHAPGTNEPPTFFLRDFDFGLRVVHACTLAEVTRASYEDVARFGYRGFHDARRPLAATGEGAGRAEAERMTSLICAPAYAALDGASGPRFVELVNAIRAALD